MLPKPNANMLTDYQILIHYKFSRGNSELFWQYFYFMLLNNENPYTNIRKQHKIMYARYKYSIKYRNQLISLNLFMKRYSK